MFSVAERKTVVQVEVRQNSDFRADDHGGAGRKNPQVHRKEFEHYSLHGNRNDSHRERADDAHFQELLA